MATEAQTETFARAAILSALATECHRAQREFPKVGTPRAPTPWDVRHRELNRLLSALEATPD